MPPSVEDTIDEESDEALADHATSKRERLKAFGKHVKSVPKRLLMRIDVLTSTDSQLDGDGKVIKGVTDNPSFDTGMLMPKEHNAIGGVILNTVGYAKEAALVIAHPRNHAKIKAAGKFTASEHPYLTEDADRELLEAHDDLNKASINADGVNNAEKQQERVNELERGRDAARNAWITGKHVKRVQVVPAKLVDYPLRSDFREYNEAGKFVRWQWERYIGHLILYGCQGFVACHVDDTNDLPFKRGTLKHHAERVLVASSVWQVWFMHVRKVYLWQQPLLTLQWLSCWLFLLKTGYIMTFAYLWIVFITVKNRVMGDDLRFLREAQERASDPNATTQKLSELVNRHGNEGWVDAVLDELGPLLQQQLGDLADFLEMLSNFYSWRDPRATINSLLFWLTAAFVSAMVSTEFGIKMVWYGCGLYFFLGRPIASLYPRYRKIVSLIRYAFWDIPTHAELAFQELRAKAQTAREETIRRRVQRRAEEELSANNATATPSTTNLSHSITYKASNSNDYTTALSAQKIQLTSDSDSDSDTASTTSRDGDILDNTDFLSFRGIYASYNGRLIITSTGLRFTRSLSPKHALRHASLLFRKTTEPTTSSAAEEVWSRPFSQLVSLRKARTASVSITKRQKLFQMNALVITWVGGEEMWIESMRKRDEAFNCIIGFSGRKFQSLQPEMGEVEGEGDGILKPKKGAGRGRGGGHVAEELQKV